MGLSLFPILVIATSLLLFGCKFVVGEIRGTPSPFKPVSGNTPLESNPKNLMEHCDKFHRPCLPAHSLCLDSKCQCSPGYTISRNLPNLCLKVVDSVGGKCVVNEQCEAKLGKLSSCRNYKCVCENGAKKGKGGGMCVQEEKISAKKLLVGDKCSKTEDCVGDQHALCTSAGICVCRDGFVPTAKLDDCLPVIHGIGKECWETQQCQYGITGALSECNLTTSGVRHCKCGHKAVHAHGKDECFPLAAMKGDTCIIQEQCLVWLKGHCLDGKCECLPGTHIHYSNSDYKCVLDLK